MSFLFKKNNTFCVYIKYISDNEYHKSCTNRVFKKRFKSLSVYVLLDQAESFQCYVLISTFYVLSFCFFCCYQFHFYIVNK